MLLLKTLAPSPRDVLVRERSVDMLLILFDPNRLWPVLLHFIYLFILSNFQFDFLEGKNKKSKIYF